MYLHAGFEISVREGMKEIHTCIMFLYLQQRLTRGYLGLHLPKRHRNITSSQAPELLILCTRQTTCIMSAINTCIFHCTCTCRTNTGCHTSFNVFSRQEYLRRSQCYALVTGLHSCPTVDVLHGELANQLQVTHVQSESRGRIICIPRQSNILCVDSVVNLARVAESAFTYVSFQTCRYCTLMEKL